MLFVPKTGEKGASRKCLLYGGACYASTVFKIGTEKCLCNDADFKLVLGSRTHLVDHLRDVMAHAVS